MRQFQILLTFLTNFIFGQFFLAPAAGDRLFHLPILMDQIFWREQASQLTWLVPVDEVLKAVPARDQVDIPLPNSLDGWLLQPSEPL